MSNTNTHNPYGVAQIDPSDWTFVADFYRGNDYEIERYYQESYVTLARAINGTDEFEPEDWDKIIGHKNGGCASCGAAFLYGVVFTDGDVFIQVGHTCGADHFNQPSIVELNRVRAVKAAQNLKAQRAANASAEKFVNEHDGLKEALNNTDHGIVHDIRSKLVQYGSLSQGQVDLVFKIAGEQAEYTDRKAVREAELANTPALTEGRYEITGKVISVKAQDSDYGTQYKQLVELPDGNRVWGTIPSSILDEVWNSPKGTSTVTFTAAVERSKDDEHFGFYKRPTKPTVTVS